MRLMFAMKMHLTNRIFVSNKTHYFLLILILKNNEYGFCSSMILLQLNTYVLCGANEWHRDITLVTLDSPREERLWRKFYFSFIIFIPPAMSHKCLASSCTTLHPA